MAASSDDHDNQTLPDEVLTEILARLPAKSVGRCSCLSRAWRATLSSDYFVDLHARLANKPGHPQLLLSPVGSSYDGYIYSWRRSRGGGAVVEKLMRDDFGGEETVPLTKPCRGLVLIRATYGGGYFVCNPSTGESLALPDSEAPRKMMDILTKSLHGLKSPFYRRISYGLGYCTTSKVYKVARLFSKLEADDDEGEDGSKTSTRCEVFVLGASGYWRPSAGNPPSLCSVKEENPAVFLNGYLHFLCCDGGIITINISDETFGSLPPPPGLFKNETAGEPLLTELNGHLCLCYGDAAADSEDLYHIWALRDRQWMKLCCIDGTAWPESERKLLWSLWFAPLCVYYSSNNGGKKIMFGTGACNVLALDLDGGGGAPEILLTPHDTIIGSCEDHGVAAIGLFEESLAMPVGRSIEDTLFSSPTAKVWFHILKWLPTRSVLELRLVCREWHEMIMSDCFVRSHAVHANMERSPRIRFSMDHRFGRYMDMDKCKGEDALQPKHGFVCSQPCHGLNVGSCNFWDFVCNPTIGYHEDMPLEGDDDTFFAGRIGLGFHTEINRHILVRIIIYKEKNLETRHYELECTARYVNEKLWRSIDPPSRPIAGTPPTFVDGKIYWMVDPNLGSVSSASCEIVAFDVETDEFEVVQGPPCSHGGGSGQKTTILQLQGGLCVACSDQSRNRIDMWMMKDFGIWSMEYHILLDDLSANTTPLADDPKDGRVLLNTGRSLGYYDPKTTAFETIYTMRIDTPPDVDFFPIVCHESLVCPLLI